MASGSSGTMTENVSVTQSFDWSIIYVVSAGPLGSTGKPGAQFVSTNKNGKISKFGNFDFPTKILLIVKSKRLSFADLKNLKKLN
jgi:hypothetical protein